MSIKKAEYDAIVIGAGFSGIRSLWELQNLGLTVKCFEAGSDVGGAWYWNRYPGARTDGEAWNYIMNFTPEVKEDWDFRERYPSREAILSYLNRIVDRFGLRKYIEFDMHTVAADYNDNENIWTITNMDGSSTTCRYFLPATGIMSVPKEPDFAGLDLYTGELYQTSSWPSHSVEFDGKRIAIVGTGSTGAQIIPVLAHAAKELTVFQRTPNYVLPGRNYTIDEYQAAEIKRKYDATWELAKRNLAGHASKPSGRRVEDVRDGNISRQIFDYGWERGCFNFQLETFDDIFTNPEANSQAAEFVRGKIRAIVQDPEKAELLCPTYPIGSKRPPCGHSYYETFNRSNVNIVDISRHGIELYEKGIRTGSGAEYECDMIIFALGFDAGTGALNKIAIRGSQGKSLKEHWKATITTFAGILVSGFPNMFVVCGPHMPTGNVPVVLEIAVDWIGQAIHYMESKGYVRIDVSKEAVDRWSTHHDKLWESIFISDDAVRNRAWFVGTNISGKPARIMFYYGGVASWASWLEDEINMGWINVEFSTATKRPSSNGFHELAITGGVHLTAQMLESAVVPLQSDEAGISQAEKFNLGSAACARYIDWAVKEIYDRGLVVKQDYRAHWWKVLQAFAESESGQALARQSPDTEDELDRFTSKLGVEGEAISQIGPKLVGLLTGQILPLSLLLKNNLLFRLYLSDEGARPNRYVADYVKTITSQKKDLKILEIGAGTGGTTIQVLRACSPAGESFCSEYVYTDISSGFFKTSQTTLKKWEHLLTFQTLNVEDDPTKQGFKEHAYDMIIAANVVHATRSLQGSLATIHKLLKPGGVLGLIELTRLTPFYNMVFGSLPGWWAGVNEGRTESPLQSPQQWDEQLRKSGFSGVDTAAYDLPEPERHSALLLSTALR